MFTLDFLLLVFFYTFCFSVKLHYIFIFQLDLIQMFTKPIITVNGTHNDIVSKVMNAIKRCVCQTSFQSYLVLIYNLMVMVMHLYSAFSMWIYSNALYNTLWGTLPDCFMAQFTIFFM